MARVFGPIHGSSTAYDLIDRLLMVVVMRVPRSRASRTLMSSSSFMDEGPICEALADPFLLSIAYRTQVRRPA